MALPDLMYKITGSRIDETTVAKAPAYNILNGCAE